MRKFFSSLLKSKENRLTAVRFLVRTFFRYVPGSGLPLLAIWTIGISLVVYMFVAVSFVDSEAAQIAKDVREYLFTTLDSAQ